MRLPDRISAREGKPTQHNLLEGHLPQYVSQMHRIEACERMLPPEPISAPVVSGPSADL